MSKGKHLFEDFLQKAGESFKDPGDWDKMVAVWSAREALENYIDPPRDAKGHFVSANDTPIQEEG